MEMKKYLYILLLLLPACAEIRCDGYGDTSAAKCDKLWKLATADIDHNKSAFPSKKFIRYCCEKTAGDKHHTDNCIRRMIYREK